jgi:hypothetical protein
MQDAVPPGANRGSHPLSCGCRVCCWLWWGWVGVAGGGECGLADDEFDHAEQPAPCSGAFGVVAGWV